MVTGIEGLPLVFTHVDARKRGISDRELYEWRDAFQIETLGRASSPPFADRGVMHPLTPSNLSVRQPLRAPEHATPTPAPTSDAEPTSPTAPARHH